MALDGIFLKHIKNELEQKLINGRVDKIYQPSRDELVFQIRTREDNFKLLLSARPDTARLHITKASFENPKQPPMLCMLMRKHLQGAKLSEITQDKLERVLHFYFEGINELGDKVRLCLVCEIMGKHSNIILLNENNKIIDALKRVSADNNSDRLLFPGLTFTDAPKQDKLCILDYDNNEIINAINNLPKLMQLNKALMAVLQGISPINAREIENIVGRGEEVFELNNYQIDRLNRMLNLLRETVKNCDGSPITVVTDKPIDFSFWEISQYGNLAKIRKDENFSSLLDRYYSERDQIERMRVKSSDILKLLANRTERIARKISNQQAEISNCKNKETKKNWADLINSNLYAIEKGFDSVILVDFYDENMPEIEIKLDPSLSPTQNAQKYYKEYRKGKTAEVKLAEQIALGKSELDYLETLFYSLSQAQTEQDLSEIRTELCEGGYIKTQKKGKQKETISKPLQFVTSDGFTVLVGKNNKQNDKLTLKDANRNDIWLHTKDIHGSHTILVTNGQEVTETAIYEASVLAARHSKAKNSASVPVDYTKVRYVSKPSGAKPGMVIYVNQKTLFVDPQEKLEE